MVVDLIEMMMIQEITVSDAFIALDVHTYTRQFAKSVDFILLNFSSYETVQTALHSAIKSIQNLNTKVCVLAL